MILLKYLSEIAEAKTARELHNLRDQAEADSDLTPKDREFIGRKVAHKFAALNAAVTRFQPRWA